MKLATFITNIFSQIQTRKICIVNHSQNLQKPRTKNTKRNYEYTKRKTMCTKRYKYSYVKNKIIQHIIYIYFFARFWLNIQHCLLLFFSFYRYYLIYYRTTYRTTNPPSPPRSIQSIQFLYTAEPRIAQRSRQYFAAICGGSRVRLIQY